MEENLEINNEISDGNKSNSEEIKLSISEKENNAFKIRLGTLGCDNKLIY